MTSPHPSDAELASAWDRLAHEAQAQGHPNVAQAFQRCRRDLINRTDPEPPD